jgi:hypothetical protein
MRVLRLHVGKDNYLLPVYGYSRRIGVLISTGTHRLLSTTDKEQPLHFVKIWSEQGKGKLIARFDPCRCGCDVRIAEVIPRREQGKVGGKIGR